MDILNIAFGIVTVISFIFSIYTYFKTESKKKVEAVKNGMIKEKLKAIEKNLIKIFHTSDMIVQIPKNRKIDISELQNLGRLIRVDTKITIDYLKEQEQKLNKWRFGEVVETKFEGDEEKIEQSISKE